MNLVISTDFPALLARVTDLCYFQILLRLSTGFLGEPRKCIQPCFLASATFVGLPTIF